MISKTNLVPGDIVDVSETACPVIFRFVYEIPIAAPTTNARIKNAQKNQPTLHASNVWSWYKKNRW